MNPLSRRTLVRAGAALCIVPVSFDSVAQAPSASFEGPGPIELGTGATHIQLLRTKLDTLTITPKRAVLQFGGLVARTAPGVAYGVHLSLPASSQTIGLIAFSDAPSHQSFDITALLPPLGDALVVSVVPHGEPAAHAAPRIGRLFIAAA